MDRSVLINNKGKVLEAEDKDGNWYKIMGNCLRCGKCCKEVGCEYLYFESIENKNCACCKLQGRHGGKPWGCMIYPNDPNEALPDYCGYKWRKI